MTVEENSLRFTDRYLMSLSKSDKVHPVKVHIEYCGVCDYGGHCITLAKTIQETTPTAEVICKRGRQGSFEILVNEKKIYSKLQTMALPDYKEVADVVNNVSNGSEPKEIKGEQPINCVIS